MASVLFKNAWVVGSGPADVGVRNGRISLVGTAGPEADYERVIEAGNYALMPGLINTHGHGAMTLLRSVADDLPLKEWLETRIWPLEDKLTGTEVYWGTMLAIVEMLKGGTTTFTDMYFFEDRVAQAAAETGIRAVLCRGLVALGPNFEQALAESRDFVRAWNGAKGGRITAHLGPHALYTCPPPHLDKVLDLAAELKVPLQIHVSESPGEVEESYKQYGKSPVEVLAEAGLFAHPVLAAHCVHLKERDLDLLAAHDVRVAHNPTSNLKLGNGIAPVPALLQRGVTVGLGSDGAASNNNLDMLEEVRLAALIHKGVHNDPTLIPAAQALALATTMGARAVFLDGEIGTIAEGMKADIILIDLNKPHLIPRHDVDAHIVYSAQAADVSLVMVDGQILVEEGKLTTIDEERILFEAARCARELTG
jgi:5-methylthioadenosine/S-adenosylhomocysteine deaminase